MQRLSHATKIYLTCRVLFSLLLVLTAVNTARPAGFLAERDSLVRAALEKAGRDPAGDLRMTLAMARLNVNIAQNQVVRDIAGAIQKKDSITGSKTVVNYALNADVDTVTGCLKRINLNNGRVWTIPVIGVSLEAMRQLRTSIDKGQPSKDSTDPNYYNVQANQITFYPQPLSSDTFYVNYDASATALTAASDTTLIRQRYRHLILLKAAELILRDIQEEGRAEIMARQYELELRRSSARSVSMQEVTGQ